MIKIRWKPVISEYEDRWGRVTGPFYVHTYTGYVTEDFWKEIQELQNYFPESHDPDPAKHPILARLIERAGGQVREFNMETSVGSGNYIRSIAVLGHKNLRKDSLLLIAQVAVMKLIVKYKNWKRQC